MRGRECRTTIQTHCEVFRKSHTWNLDQWNRRRCRHGQIIVNFQSEKYSLLNDQANVNEGSKQVVSEDRFALLVSACVSSGNLDLHNIFHCAKFIQSHWTCVLSEQLIPDPCVYSTLSSSHHLSLTYMHSSCESSGWRTWTVHPTSVGAGGDRGSLACYQVSSQCYKNC